MKTRSTQENLGRSRRPAARRSPTAARPLSAGIATHCASCGHTEIFWNSCRNRHCPQCGGEARRRWLDARNNDVLPVPYFHVVFTIPSELHALAMHAPAVVYGILVRAAGRALVDVGRTRIRATLAILAVLHTWGQELWFHPHVHCVVTGGGLSRDGRRWIRIRKVVKSLGARPTVVGRGDKWPGCSNLRNTA